MLKGKRVLSNTIKRKIAERLVLSPSEAHEFFASDLPENLKMIPDDRLTISQDQFHLISDWWYFALLSLLKTKNFRNNVGWMASRLGLKPSLVVEAWDRLFRLGYLGRQGAKVVHKQPNLKTTDNLKDLSIRKSHLEDLKLIENSLLNVPIEFRDNYSSTFVVNKEDLPKIKEMVRVFHTQLLSKVGRESGDEVYKISVALYPLTKISENSL